MQAEITVRRVRAEEWERLRAIRLRALADAPMAFGSTLAGEQAQPDEFWRGRAAGGAADDDRATFIAECDGEWVGLGTCVLEAGGAGERPAWVFGMWVDPVVRRQGTAQALLRAQKRAAYSIISHPRRQRTAPRTSGEHSYTAGRDRVSQFVA